MAENEDIRPRRSCPHCAEMIVWEAKVCRFCGRDAEEQRPTRAAVLPDTPTPPTPMPVISAGPPVQPPKPKAAVRRMPASAVLATGVVLILGGLGLTGSGAIGYGFLALWLGLVVMLHRFSIIVSVLGGFVVACVLWMLPAMFHGVRRIAAQQAEDAAKKQVDAEKAAEEAKRRNAELVATFPQNKGRISNEIATAEKLTAAGKWADASNALTRADLALQPILAHNELAATPEVVSMKQRLDKVRPAILKEVAAAQEREKAAQAKRARQQEQEELRNLLGWYKQNEVRADQLYKGQHVRVRGYVKDVKKDILNNAYITIGREQWDLEVPTVQCFLADSAIAASASLSPGEMVTVAGRVDGLMFNVLVKECTLP